MAAEEQGPRNREPAGLVQRSHGFSVRSLDAEKRSISVIASSESLDSHDEVVEQKWRFARYEKNPVILWAHNKAAGHDGLPIGRGENWRVEGKGADAQLKMDIVFASADANPFADSVFKLFQEEILKSVSVGFRPHSVRLEKRKSAGDEDEIFVLSDNELYELSVVPVGSNPDAVALGADDSLVRMKDAARAVAKNHTARTAEEQTNQMDAEKEVKDLRVALEESRAEKLVAVDRAKELESKLATVTAERDAHLAASQKHERKLIEREVEELVGKKINSAQREEFIELRQSFGEKKFASFVEKMTELPILKTVVKDDTEITNKTAKTKGQPVKIAALFNKAEG